MTKESKRDKKKNERSEESVRQGNLGNLFLEQIKKRCGRHVLQRGKRTCRSFAFNDGEIVRVVLG